MRLWLFVKFYFLFLLFLCKKKKCFCAEHDIRRKRKGKGKERKMETKKTYSSPEIQFILSDQIEIISTSGGIGEDPGTNEGEWM